MKKKKKAKGKGFSLFKKKVKNEDLVVFSKQFATMVKAGLPILQVLEMLRDQVENPAMKDVIEDIRKSLEEEYPYQNLSKNILIYLIMFT